MSSTPPIFVNGAVLALAARVGARSPRPPMDRALPPCARRCDQDRPSPARMAAGALPRRGSPWRSPLQVQSRAPPRTRIGARVTARATSARSRLWSRSFGNGAAEQASHAHAPGSRSRRACAPDRGPRARALLDVARALVGARVGAALRGLGRRSAARARREGSRRERVRPHSEGARSNSHWGRDRAGCLPDRGVGRGRRGSRDREGDGAAGGRDLRGPFDARRRGLRGRRSADGARELVLLAGVGPRRAGLRRRARRARRYRDDGTTRPLAGRRRCALHVHGQWDRLRSRGAAGRRLPPPDAALARVRRRCCHLRAEAGGRGALRGRVSRPRARKNVGRAGARGLGSGPRRAPREDALAARHGRRLHHLGASARRARRRAGRRVRGRGRHRRRPVDRPDRAHGALEERDTHPDRVAIERSLGPSGAADAVARITAAHHAAAGALNTTVSFNTAADAIHVAVFNAAAGAINAVVVFNTAADAIHAAAGAIHAAVAVSTPSSARSTPPIARSSPRDARSTPRDARSTPPAASSTPPSAKSTPPVSISPSSPSSSTPSSSFSTPSPARSTPSSARSTSSRITHDIGRGRSTPPSPFSTPGGARSPSRGARSTSPPRDQRRRRPSCGASYRSSSQLGSQVRASWSGMGWSVASRSKGSPTRLAPSSVSSASHFFGPPQ